MRYVIDVDIVTKKKQSMVVEVEIDSNKFYDCQEDDEVIEYIEDETMKQYPDAKKVAVSPEELAEVLDRIADDRDEDFEEYSEYTDFDEDID